MGGDLWMWNPNSCWERRKWNSVFFILMLCVFFLFGFLAEKRGKGVEYFLSVWVRRVWKVKRERGKGKKILEKVMTREWLLVGQCVSRDYTKVQKCDISWSNGGYQFWWK